ncbi:hypothetical protein J2Y60_002380 [Arcicella sp. BE140]|nr:hypothetical protein [Arcicella sp. BE51]MDR6812181.1 hypothetical protein [Arcicella sp. BE140]MDR6823493.1 hypothetical protein [Arcicella sp. BE139]
MEISTSLSIKLTHYLWFNQNRMEPVFMILGQSAATAAVLSINNKVSPQQLPYSKLKSVLLKYNQRLEF